MSEPGDSLIRKKVIAYFHDPPWKAWVISRNILNDSAGEPPPSGGHEDHACYLISRLGFQCSRPDRDIPDDVRFADKLSSAIDRWVIAKTYEGSESGLMITKMKYKLNVFSPWMRFEVGEGSWKLSWSRISSYVNELSSIIANGVESPNLRYHLAYFLAPLIWYEVFPNVPPLADTRAPTHTVFDHGSATAAMLNIVSCSSDRPQFHGHVVVVDFPSVQEFITYSRKTRDLWASSWLVSALLWGSIKDFVDRYGPDVVLRPELSLNHFFIAWLYRKVRKLAEDKAKRVKYYAEKYAKLEGNPRISMMGDKVILLLPDQDGASIRNAISKGFRESWEQVAETILSSFDNDPTIDDTIRKYIKEAEREPPVEPIIQAVSVSEVYNDYVKRLGLSSEDLRCREGPVPLEYSLFFEYLIKRALSYRAAKYSYGTTISGAVREVTSKGNYRVCTVCGVLPAALYYHDSKDDVDHSEGSDVSDRLCPYCAVKRNLSKSFSKVLEKLDLKVSDEKFSFPSTADLAMASFRERLKHSLKNKGAESLMDSQFSEEVASYFGGNREAVNKVKLYLDILQVDQKLFNDLLTSYGSVYYAVIKADGDCMGKGLWSGLLPDRSNVQAGGGANECGLSSELTISKYIKYVVEALADVEPNAKDSLNELLKGADDVEKRISDLRRRLYGGNGLGTSQHGALPLTPAYAYALSRALTMQAIIDKELIEAYGGYAIYLGGDDVLAISPVRFPLNINDSKDELVALEIVRATRHAYWKYCEGDVCPTPDAFPDGFKSYNGLLVDSLRPYGRSYAIYVSHYKDPMAIAIYMAASLLELKDKSIGKDVMFASSGRGAVGLEYSALGLRNEKGELDLNRLYLAEKIYDLIEQRMLSRSFVYDVLELDRYSSSDVVYQGLIMRAVERNLLVRGDERTKISQELYNDLIQYLGRPTCMGEACSSRGSAGRPGRPMELVQSIVKLVNYMNV